MKISILLERFTVYLNCITNKKSIMIFMLFFIFLLFRIINLEFDLPEWDVMHYQSIDENYYCIGGYNLYKFGEYSPDPIDHDLIRKDISSVKTIFINLIVYFSLLIFGNNYYGIRMASVFASLVSFILFLILLYKILYDDFSNKSLIIKKNKTKNYIYIIFSFIFLFDFNFIMASRILEPTIFRIAGMVFIMFLLVIYDTLVRKKQILLGIVTSGVVFFIYPTNLFILLAVFMYIIVYSGFNNNQKKIKIIVFLLRYLFGIFLTFLFLYFLQEILIKISIFQDLGYSVSTYSKNISFFTKSIHNVINIFKANFFRFNPLTIFMFISIFPLVLYSIIKNLVIQKIDFYKRKNIIIVLLFLISFLLQTLFINDYPRRKLIIMLPLLLLICAYYINNLKEINNIINKTFLQIYTIISVIGTMILFCLFNDFTYNQKFLFIIGILTIICFAILLFFKIFKNSNSFFIQKVLLFFTLFLFVFFQSILIYNHIFCATYTSKKIRKEIGSIVGNDVLGGSWSIGFRLYHDAKTVLNPYKYYDNRDLETKLLKHAFKNNQINYIISYDNFLKDEILEDLVLIRKFDYYNDAAGKIIVIYKNKFD